MLLFFFFSNFFKIFKSSMDASALPAELQRLLLLQLLHLLLLVTGLCSGFLVDLQPRLSSSGEATRAGRGGVDSSTEQL